MKNILISAGLLLLGGPLAFAQQAAAAKTAPSRKATDREVVVYTTAKSTKNRIAATDTLRFKEFGQPVETQACVFVDPSKKFQSIVGIGGALTDASAETFAKLSAPKQAEILEAYFDPKKGIGYSLARTSIHSCDFSSGSYTYVAEKDKDLKTFSVEHDRQYRIPFIKRAIQAAGGHLTTFVSPWSPPAWMKDNNDILHGGKLLPEYRQAWANYYTKFIRAYEKEGIPIWGLTVQNEPMAKQTWESCIYTAEEERDFVKNFLGPTLQRAGLGQKKIIIWDHNRDLMFQRASTVLDDPAAAKFVWGVGFHWYVNDVFDNVERVHEAYPAKNLLFTEGCNYPFSMETLDDWKWGENYGRAMIHDFNNGANGWTDWNVLLDETGGPNHVKNFCLAPVHADTRSDRLIYTNSFYYLGHFSKFIRPGARRVTCSTNRDNLLATAFLNTDGSLAVVVMNSSDESYDFRLWIKGKAAETKSLPHSIVTLMVR